MKRTVHDTTENGWIEPGEETEPVDMAPLKTIKDVITDKKGQDVVVMDISGQSSFADFFVNATAANTRMLATLREELEKRLTALGIPPRGVEGKVTSGWVLLDCGDIIVNLFLEEQRNTYQIEKIWSDGTIVDVD
ncbi:MAG: ribosome silencing factor [Clostridiales Family XIII bacterium]|nr:ribosome silencing factor [Clostridiales Family XIII bacterium]